MILLFLGSMRATVAVFFSIPLSALAAFMAHPPAAVPSTPWCWAAWHWPFSRLIDNSVVVLENIYRHLELGEPPEVAAEKGGQRGGARRAGRHADHGRRLLPRHLSLRREPVLCSPRWPWPWCCRCSRRMLVAMTVVPLFCARFIKGSGTSSCTSMRSSGVGSGRIVAQFSIRYFRKMFATTDHTLGRCLLRPAASTLGLVGVSFLLSLCAVSRCWAFPFSRAPIPASS